jgi:hypothetical protein
VRDAHRNAIATTVGVRTLSKTFPHGTSWTLYSKRSCFTWVTATPSVYC